LLFTLSSSEGDFRLENLNLQGKGNLVTLDCASCNINAGIRLAFPLRGQTNSVSFDGTTQKFVLKLDEKSGWLKDPKNVLFSWLPPTQCEFVEVLTKLSGLQILGDFTKRYETVSLDSVSLYHGPGQPLACYT